MCRPPWGPMREEEARRGAALARVSPIEQEAFEKEARPASRIASVS